MKNSNELIIIIVCKGIHWEICKKFKFDHTYKSYTHNSASVIENDTHKLLWDFIIQSGQKTRPFNNQQTNKQKKIVCKIVDFAVPVDHRKNLKECEKKDKYLDLARELKKL